MVQKQQARAVRPGTVATRLVAAGMALALAGLVVAGRVVPTLNSRYDREALRVAPPVEPGPEPVGAPQRAAWGRLQAWCFEGAGDGRCPFGRPGARPRVDQRFTVAVLNGAPEADLPALAKAFSRHIDGSDQLNALGSAVARLLLRLRVKLHDATWWFARQPVDPWDSGYLVDEPVARRALHAFRPRQATLLVALHLPAAALQKRISLLAARSGTFAHPVRLLVIGSQASPAWGDVTVIETPPV